MIVKERKPSAGGNKGDSRGASRGASKSVSEAALELFSDVDVAPPRLQDGDTATVDIALIEPTPDQPRQTFDPVEILQMAQTMKDGRGVENDITVRWKPDGTFTKFLIIAGEQRYRAALEAGLEKVPIKLRDVNAAQAHEMALRENIVRTPLSNYDVAHAVARMKREQDLSNIEIGKRLGRKPGWVYNRVEAGNLPPDIDAAFKANPDAMMFCITLAHRSLTPDQNRYFCARIKSKRTNEETLRADLKRMYGPEEEVKVEPLPPSDPPPTPDDTRVLALDDMQRGTGYIEAARPVELAPATTSDGQDLALAEQSVGQRLDEIAARVHEGTRSGLLERRFDRESLETPRETNGAGGRSIGEKAVLELQGMLARLEAIPGEIARADAVLPEEGRQAALKVAEAARRLGMPR